MIKKSEVIKGAADLHHAMTSGAGTKVYHTQHSVQAQVYKDSFTPTLKFEAQKATMLTIKSNYARDRAVVINNGELVLVFDNKGIAKMPSHLRTVLEYESKFRPGRYTILDDLKVVPVTIDEVLEVEPVVEPIKVVEVQVEVVSAPEAAPEKEDTKNVTTVIKTKKVSKEK